MEILTREQLEKMSNKELAMRVLDITIEGTQLMKLSVSELSDDATEESISNTMDETDTSELVEMLNIIQDIVNSRS